VKIRVEIITHYMKKYSAEIIERKKAMLSPNCPL